MVEIPGQNGYMLEIAIAKSRLGKQNCKLWIMDKFNYFISYE